MGIALRSSQFPFTDNRLALTFYRIKRSVPSKIGRCTPITGGTPSGAIFARRTTAPRNAAARFSGVLAGAPPDRLSWLLSCRPATEREGCVNKSLRGFGHGAGSGANRHSVPLPNQMFEYGPDGPAQSRRIAGLCRKKFRRVLVRHCISALRPLIVTITSHSQCR